MKTEANGRKKSEPTAKNATMTKIETTEVQIERILCQRCTGDSLVALQADEQSSEFSARAGKW